jgi:protease-4
MLERAKDLTDQIVGQIGDQIDQARQRRTAPLILELDLTEPLVEGVPQDPLSAIRARRLTSVRSVVDGLRRAGRDERVKALVVKVGGGRSPLSLARAQEVREAVTAFRAQGKLAVAWAESFGELGRGTVSYYLATAFGEVWLQPSGELGVTGVSAEVPFVRGALDKLGITPQVAQRHEFKNAGNTFTETGFTPAHREATERLVESMTEQLVGGIAEGRDLDVAAVRAHVDRAPLFADESLDGGLVDHLGYRDEVYASVRERVGEEAALLFVGRYQRPKLEELQRRIGTARSSDGKLALVHVTGPIHLGRSGRQPLQRESTGSDSVAAALRAAVADDDVKGIVLRVSSPGGSYVASDTIWREVALAREAGKPVVASMGDVAASGGYFVAMGADAIVAQPGTLTGSIGVLAGKPVVTPLAERLGIDHESVASGRHARMLSPFQEFTEDEWARLDVWLNRIYDDFVNKAAEGRGMTVERLHGLAKGRVWTGADAKEHGLVDELGGLATAIDLARERAGLPATDEPELQPYPPMAFLARLKPPTSSDDPAAAGARLRLDAWGSYAQLATALGLPAHGPLTLSTVSPVERGWTMSV